MARTILIIEDNEQNMYMLTYLLTNDGYTVQQAFTGPDGIALARRSVPDIVLLDIQLPQMDGYTVAGHLRELPGLERTPIIAVTSYAMPGDKEKALASGATGYIEKPINPETFIAQMLSFVPANGAPERNDR